MKNINDFVNKIICGDCLEVMKEIPDKSIDMILQDPPYFSIACEWEWDIMTKIEELWAEWKRIIKDNGAIVMTASQPFTSKLIMSNLDMFKYELIWDKRRGFEPQLAMIRPQKSHENILIFCKGKTTYNPQKTILDKLDRRIGSGRRNNRIDGTGHNLLSSISSGEKEYKDRFSLSIQFFGNANQKDKQHPTQKPLLLFEYLIKTYTNECNIVFDGFCGSGTTAVACHNLNRNFICIDKEEKYIEISNQRYDKAVKEKLPSINLKTWIK